MSLFRANLVLAISATLLATPAFATRTHKGKSHASATPHLSGAHGHSAHHSGTGKVGAKTSAAHSKVHGQQAIAPERVTEIQQALVREHYLDKDANGQWDATTEAAMQKYQADQGWQTKLMPDSRALKKLGLGPDYSTAINAKTGAFTDPPPVSTLPPAVAAGFTQGSGVNR